MRAFFIYMCKNHYGGFFNLTEVTFQININDDFTLARNWIESIEFDENHVNNTIIVINTSKDNREWKI